MATVTAPLLSLHASGQIGRALVAYTWHGIDCMRQYVIPANPRTTAQQANRAHMTTAVAAWRHLIPTPEFRPSWNLYARSMDFHGTGYHVAMGQYARLAALGGDPLVATHAYRSGPDICQIVCVGLVTHAPTVEVFPFDVFAARQGDPLTHFQTVTPGGNSIRVDGTEAAFGKLVSLQLYRQHWRSGIFEVTHP